MNERAHLFASVLLDPPGSRTSRQLGKVQVSSLLRTLFPGEVVIWRNFPEPLYMMERKGVHEVDFIPDRPVEADGLKDLTRVAKCQMARSLVDHASRYEWVILADAGVMALRNWDHLFERSEAEVLVTRSREGKIDPGLIAIRSEVFEKFVLKWEAVTGSGRGQDELALVLQSDGFEVREFERGEVVRALDDGVGFREVMKAAVVVLDGMPTEMTEAAFALHMMKTFGDKDGLFLELLES